MSIPSISVTYAQDGRSTKANAFGMRPMQERAYQKRGEQYLLIKSPPASGKSRALMFIALDKLKNQKLKQAIIVVPEKSIGASFHDEPLSQDGFFADWTVAPKWNLCDAPGTDSAADGGKVEAVKKFLDSGDKPSLDDEDQEAVRQRAVAAMNILQQAKRALLAAGAGSNHAGSTALIDGVRRFMSVKELDIDLIDRINPFGEAYAILAKAMSEERLRAVAAVIASKRLPMTIEEARDLAKRAKRFKDEKGRLPSLTASDPWEKRMAEGVAFLQRKAKEAKNG